MNPQEERLQQDLALAELACKDVLGRSYAPARLEPRKYQAEAIGSILGSFKEFNRLLAVLPTGAGKTLLFAWLAQHFLPKRTLILAHRDELIEQAIQKISAATGIAAQKEKAEWTASLSAPIVVASVQTMIRRLDRWPSDHFGLLVVDECFVAGTLVDGRPIETIKKGDTVRTRFGHGTVTHTFKQQANELCRIEFEHGLKFVCTPNHPIYTVRGFVRAINLTTNDVVVTSRFYERLHHLQQPYRTKIVREPEMSIRAIPENDGQCPEEIRGPNHSISKTQWHERPKCACAGVGKAKGHGVEAANSRRQRRTDSGASVDDGKNARMGNGGRDPDSNEDRQRLSPVVSGRPGQPGAENRRGDRWKFAQMLRPPITGQEKGSLPEFARMVGREVLKPGSDGKFESLCPDGFVYNLEVSNGNTYFANGILVHNCHHSVSDSWQTVLSHFNAQVLGVTATPDRGDKRTLGSFFEAVAAEVHLVDLIRQNYLCPITIKSVPLRIDLNQVHIRAGDFSDEELGHILEPYLSTIARSIREHASFRKVLAFLPLIDTSLKFVAACNAAGLVAKHVDGQSPDRKETLKRFADGEFDVLSNAMLLTEGYDEPTIDCIVILRPTRSRPLYAQMCGRGTRIHETKENLLILDFLWLHEKHRIIHPADLVAFDTEEADIITELAEERSASGEDDRLDLLALASSAAQEREERLRKKLGELANRKAKFISAEEFCLAHGNIEAATYQPTMQWEFKSVTEGQKKYLEQANLDVETITGRGHASVILDMIFKEKNLELASSKQRWVMAKNGYPNAWKATRQEARQYFAKLNRKT